MSKYLFETAFALGVISAIGSTIASTFVIFDIIRIKTNVKFHSRLIHNEKT